MATGTRRSRNNRSWYLISQAAIAVAAISLGAIEQLLLFCIGYVLFWLLFYFIWIGVHWIRWLAGACAGAIGFCWLIWGFGASNAIMVSFGVINLLIAGYFCLSPSVYFFAKRQRETIRWTEAAAVGAVCLLLLCSIAAALTGLWAYRNEQLQQAIEFAQTAGEEIYIKADHDWVLSHVTQRSLQHDGRERLNYFFQVSNQSLRSVREISNPHGWLQMRFHFPSRFEWDA